jgi:hypothetical protein
MGFWIKQYDETVYNIYVSGFSAEEADCRQYFKNRVLTKMAAADGAEQLREYLAELKTTGFEADKLLAQIETAPQPKDWEVGETLAEAILEDEHEAMFPWETGWDKRASRASLPGADIVGFQNKAAPRFIFGQVKSSSEKRVPPQIVNYGVDCLKNQMHSLRHRKNERQQLIQWLLPRVKGTDWESVFNEALNRYANNEYFLTGILLSGNRDIDPNDLCGICQDIQHTADDGEIVLLGYYIPIDKSEWVALTQEMGMAE